GSGAGSPPGGPGATRAIGPGVAGPGGTAEPPPRPRLTRDRSRRMIAGVAAGIARHLGLPVGAVRSAFVVLAGFTGVGAVLYALFWAVLRVDRTRPASRRHRGGQFLPVAGLRIA